jgi:hypothetical protein
VLIWLKLLTTRTKVREKLGLVDGDVLHIEVVEKGVAKLSVVRGCHKAKLAREMLENLPNLGRIKGAPF